MEISRDSWHYRLLTEDFLFAEGRSKYQISENLCGYFWQVVWRITSVSAIGILALSPCLFIVDVLSGGTPTNIFHEFLIFCGLFALMFYLVAGVVAIFTVMGRAVDPFRVKTGPAKKETQPNIFMEYVKSKKNKVCLKLEFK